MTERLSELVKRAQEDRLSPADADYAAAVIAKLHASPHAYDALFVIGKAGAVQYEGLVSTYLDAPDDPLLARLAIQVLCDWWGLADRYRANLYRFLKGTDWDLESGSYVRSVAISASGEYLRTANGGGDVLRLLVDLFDNPAESPEIRRQAYSALLRADGRSWSEVPGTASKAWLERPDAEAIARLRQRASMSPP